VLEHVTWGGAPANLAVSAHGTLIYAPSAGASADRSLVWFDRRGAESSVGVPQRAYFHPRLSPDGNHLAVGIDDGRAIEFWMWDFSQQKLTPLLLSSERPGAFSVWSRDSRHLIIGARNLFRLAADGTGVEEKLTSDRLPGHHPSAAPSKLRPTVPA
jgi:hypothetical protein